MIRIPAIDLRDGRVVRLRQGDYAAETRYADDAIELARRYAREGATHLHVVDLDAARDGGASQRGLIGSLWSIILAHATLIIPFTTWMLKGYFDTIPRELEQAAMVDGCSPLGAMVRVILPVSAPGLAATALYGFVLSWSDYAYARTFLTNAQGNWTANLGITTMKGEYISNWSDISAASILVALPILAIYLVLERYLVGGLTAGAEK